MPFLLSLAILAVAAPAASAATVHIRDAVETEDGRTYVYGVVEMAAAAGEANAVTLDFQPPARLVVTDAGAALAAGARCASADAHTVVCDASGLEGVVEIHVDLGDGDDTASAVDLDRWPYLDIRGGAGDDRLTASWATLEGEDGHDVLRGDAGAEVLHGGAGDDLLEGMHGGDHLHGGSGDDAIAGGEGHDVLLGGATVDGEDAAGTDRLEGGPGNDSLDDQDGLSGAPPGPDLLAGGAGDDAVHSYILRRAPVTVDLRREGGQGEAGEDDGLREIEDVTGGAGNDTLIGDGGPNRLDGDRGRDVVRGGGGDDVLVSEVDPREDRPNAMASAYGPDRVYGDAGDDVIETLATLESAIDCGVGRDAVRMAATSSDRAHSSRGPRVDRSCESLGMGRVRIDPFPVEVARGALTFRAPSPDCCRHRIELQTVARRPRRLASAPLRRTVRLKVAARGTLRAKITAAGSNRFVWRVAGL